jgi:hypothetical protein
MKTLSRRALLIAGLAALPLVLNCNNSNEPANRYDLIITNNSATAYEIWVNTTTGFVKAGDLLGGTRVTLRNLITNQTYTFRLSLVGNGAGTFAFENMVSSTGADVMWTVP